MKYKTAQCELPVNINLIVLIVKHIQQRGYAPVLPFVSFIREGGDTAHVKQYPCLCIRHPKPLVRKFLLNFPFFKQI